mmetsp:Transcript_3937/g.10266  ORF Transcript_3937/g.10266 Transcript_3937/m.10266 type:complete len:714 (-) Transcript_3937:1301-3442(-)
MAAAPMQLSCSQRTHVGIATKGLTWAFARPPRAALLVSPRRPWHHEIVVHGLLAAEFAAAAARLALGRRGSRLGLLGLGLLPVVLTVRFGRGVVTATLGALGLGPLLFLEAALDLVSALCLLFELLEVLAFALVRVQALLARVLRILRGILLVVVALLLLLRFGLGRLELALLLALLLASLVVRVHREHVLPAAVIVKLLDAHAVDRLHDVAPVEVGRALVELDVARVEPRLERVEMLDADGRDHHGLLRVVLEHEHQVKVLQAVHDALKVRHLDVVEGHAEPRRLRQLDDRVHGGHDVARGLAVGWHAVEAELAVGDVKLQAQLGCGLLDALRELLELLVHAVAVHALALLLLEFVGVVAGAAGRVERVGGLHDLDVELHVLGLTLADHDRVVQVEVDQHEHLLLRWLEEGELDVLKVEIELLAPRRLEAQAVGVQLQLARGLLAAHAGAHVHVAQARDFARTDELQRLLRHEILLECCLLLPSLHALPQLLDEPERVLEVVPDLSLECDLLDEVVVVPRLAWQRLRGGRGRGDEVEAQEGPARLLAQGDILDGRDVEGHQAAEDGEQERLGLAVDDRLVRLGQVGRVVVGALVSDGRLDRATRAGGAALAAAHALEGVLAHLGLELGLVLRELVVDFLCGRLRLASAARAAIHDLNAAALRAAAAAIHLIVVLRVQLVRDVRPALECLVGEDVGRSVGLDDHSVGEEERVR